MNIVELENLRKKIIRLIFIGVGVTVIIAGVVLYITREYMFLPIILITGIALSFIITIKPRNEFTLNYKKAFVLKSLQKIFTNLNYKPDMGLDREIIRNTEMMYMGDRYSSNDYISGTYKNINVIGADVHIEEKEESTDSEGHTTTTWVTLFLGKWMIFDFNKTFKANLEICQKGFQNAEVNTLFGSSKYNKVQMEDEEFNNHFRTYAQNEEEAFYILTPALMEKIKNLCNELNGTVLLCFIDNKLHVGLNNNRDSFEPSLFKKINEEEILNVISKDISLITSFIDELDLDNDLFRKGV